MLPEITFTAATAGDLPAIHRLYSQMGPRSAAPLEVLEEVFRRMESYPSFRIHAVWAGPVLCGTFSLLVFDAPGARCQPVGVVEDVVVDEAFRGQGVGARMMRYAVDRCREAGCYKMMLSSNIERTDAHRFYENLGFSLHGYSLAIPLDVTE